MKKQIYLCLGLLFLVGAPPLTAQAVEEDSTAAEAAEERPEEALEYTDMSAAALAFLNVNRTKKGIGRLVVDAMLTEAAGLHALDMAKEGFFSHDGSNGSNVGDRAQEAGYAYCVVAENIAKGQKTLDEVLRGWKDSNGHGRNMLNPDVYDFGMVRGPDDLWVLVLGQSGC